GGRQQGVGLARAVVLEPEVLLLDEPMAALDLKLRQEMRVEVKNLQERLGITFVFVTHDQEEALVMSDRIAVMNRGRIEQVGAPEALYDRPRTRFVADFLAVRNLLQATVVSISSGRAALRTPGGLAFEASDDGGYRAGAGGGAGWGRRGCAWVGAAATSWGGRPGAGTTWGAPPTGRGAGGGGPAPGGGR